MAFPVRDLIGRLARLAALPDDSAEVRLQKAMLTLVAALVILPAAGWGIAYAWLGVPASGAIPFGYAVFSGLSVAHFIRSKRYAFFRASQLLLILLLPFLLQWSLGGFAASSAVMIWALLSPLGALMFLGTRPAVPWFVAYLALAIASGLAEVWLAPRAVELSPAVRTAFYVMNVSTVSLIAYVLLQYFVRQRERAQAELQHEHRLLEHEKERSERLLLNILPAPIAERLKSHSSAVADGFEEVTVLFADIAGFTPLSEGLPPKQVVDLLNRVFSEFDAIADRLGLEKIKTIGDAYMVAGGIPEPRADHAEAVAEMALQMLDVVRTIRSPAGAPIAMRIGVNTGPVVAGVIGTRKFIYDLWGDTVNTASRMESHGEPDAIQVTEAAYHVLRHRFEFASRGVIDVKGKGAMTTYRLIGRRAEAGPERPGPRMELS